jgi:trimethylamine--corrinoid protein Co-methyltransferase
MTALRKQRRGGRSARIELRAAPLAEDKRPVKPGMTGGRYTPLSKTDMERINVAVLETMETIGFADAIPSCVELITKAGGTLTDQGRLLFPRALVEETLKIAARRFTVYGQDQRHDMQPYDDRVYFGTAGAAVHMVDIETGDYTDPTITDLYNIARLVDHLDNIHFFQRSIVARDMETSQDLDINTLYACVSGTTKHVGTSWVKPEHVTESLKMLHMIAGGEDAWRARPFVSMSSCFVVPPLKFAEDACHTLEAAVHGGMPVLLLAAGQAGATSPAALAGAVVQEMAEVLAGIVYINLLKPGHPAIVGPWPFVSDLRTGAMSGGSGEQALLSAACAQMCRYYDLPGGVCAGMSDSKMVDAQSGAEKGYTEALVGNSGANMVYESAGMHASLLGCCLESFVIDNDTIGGVLRSIRGIEVTDATLSVDAIRHVCTDGPGHFLGHQQTIELMETEYIYPTVGDRSSPKEWEAMDKPAFNDRARQKTREILDQHYPSHIGENLDASIRGAFDIKLERGKMSAKS